MEGKQQVSMGGSKTHTDKLYGAKEKCERGCVALTGACHQELSMRGHPNTAPALPKVHHGGRLDGASSVYLCLLLARGNVQEV